MDTTRTAILLGFAMFGPGCGVADRGNPPALDTDVAAYDTRILNTDYVISVPGDLGRIEGSNCFRKAGHGSDVVPGARDLCVEIFPESVAVALYLDSVTAETERWDACFDCTTYRHVRTDTISLGSRHATLQRGRRTGGIAYVDDMPELRVFIPLDADSTAVFGIDVVRQGATTDLLDVAGSLRRGEDRRAEPSNKR